MKVIVCGSRDAIDHDFVFEHLDVWDRRIGPITTVIHGDARGVDTIAAAWAISRGREVKAFPADWGQGRGAGPRRNSKMLRDGRPGFVIAFPSEPMGPGTADMIAQARTQGIRVIEVVPGTKA